MTPKSPDRGNSLGLYLHIPFCHARCGYCDFVTFTGKDDKVEEYVQDLCQEMRLYGARSVRTIFFGGGTPSVLERHHVQAILKTVAETFQLDSAAEITLEANPESVTLEKARDWRAAGINRISLGLQAYDDRLLKKMDRLHTVDQFVAAYRAVREAGFENVSIDLIYGFAEQTDEDWKATLRSTVLLNPEHLSLYALKIEAHTPFAARGYVVNDDEEAAMYAWARAFLKEEGYEQYEISNFALPGKACQHNLIYWRQEDYLGLGVGAAGCENGVRWENQKTLHAYHQDILGGRRPRQAEETLDLKTRKFERLMLGLRLREGVVWDESDSSWISKRADLLEKGLLEQYEGRWRIPDAAVALTNQVLLPFL